MRRIQAVGGAIELWGRCGWGSAFGHLQGKVSHKSVEIRVLHDDFLTSIMCVVGLLEER